jgi:hypothetical protein
VTTRNYVKRLRLAIEDADRNRISTSRAGTSRAPAHGQT